MLTKVSAALYSLPQWGGRNPISSADLSASHGSLLPTLLLGLAAAYSAFSFGSALTSSVSGGIYNCDFGEVVLVLSVAGQKMIKLNKCSVLSQAQISSGRAQGEVSLQEHSKAGLFWIPAFSRELQGGLFM